MAGFAHWWVSALQVGCLLCGWSPAAFGQPTGRTAPTAQAATEAQSHLLGFWETIDDSTHRVKSLVELYLDEGLIAGRVIRVLDPAAASHRVCEKCTGRRHGQPIEGMTILWGLTQGASAASFEGGTVLDPSNGKEYRCRVRLREDGQLDIRGFVGLPVFGRSQVWRRPDTQKASKAPAP